MPAMKWWGWGDERVAFTADDKPALVPFLQEAVGVDATRTLSRPADFGSLDVPPPALPDALRAALGGVLGADGAVSVDAHDRVVHARGKSLRDLVRHRRGD